MATIAEAQRLKVLHLHELPAWERRQPIRRLHVSDQLYGWLDQTRELCDDAYSEGGRILAEHLEQMFSDFRCARKPGGGDLRRINPTGKGIWKMHPVGLRVYGWVPVPHSFVAVTAALASETKLDRRLNDRKREEVIAFAKRHGLSNTILRGDNRALFP